MVAFPASFTRSAAMPISAYTPTPLQSSVFLGLLQASRRRTDTADQKSRTICATTSGGCFCRIFVWFRNRLIAVCRVRRDARRVIPDVELPPRLTWLNHGD